MDLLISAVNYRGKPAEYLLAPGHSRTSTISAEIQHGAAGNPDIVDIEIPDTEVFIDRTMTEVEMIHFYEANEKPLRKVARKVIDCALGAPGGLAAMAVVGLGTYEATDKVSTALVFGVGSFVAQELFRRPFIGARHLFHQIRNPWTPAAQSTARLRKGVLDT